MNASYRLNTCKSSGMCFSAYSGRRVSNTYLTFPLLGHSLWKRRLISDVVYISHVLRTKDLSVRDGDALH